MRSYIDLHCHWVAGIDDGARNRSEGLAMLQGLRRVGFQTVYATPHMRPGIFDTTHTSIAQAYAAMGDLRGEPDIPSVGLASEHFFDDVVFCRLLGGQGLPYPGNRAVLIEFSTEAMPLRVAERLGDLRRRGLCPVIAHPERYRAVWRDETVLEPLLDVGAALLLDLGSLIGKYGREPRKTAEKLLDAAYYDAACSDAHRPSDIADVERAIARLIAREGDEQAEYLLQQGPQAILDGTLDS